MNKINKNYVNSTILAYNDKGQILVAKNFLPKGINRYYKYQGYRVKKPKINESTINDHNVVIMPLVVDDKFIPTGVPSSIVK